MNKLWPLRTNNQVYLGRYSDGQSASLHDVTVTMDTADIVIKRSDGGVVASWSLKLLSTAEPLARRSVDVMILEPHSKTGTLFVADPDFVRALGRSAPHLTARARMWQGARPFFWVASVTAGIATLVVVTDFSPARSLAALLPRTTRITLGQQVMTYIAKGHRACDASAGQAALKTLSKRLSAASGVKTPFSVIVVESDVINAFAAPGEQIVIMSKLIDKAASADEVSGVLAHEMGHGIELHPEAGLIRSLGLMAITEFVLGGSGGTIANAGLYLAQLGYSRQAERQADAHGLTILRKAEISNRGIIDFFERISKNEGGRTAADPGAADSALAMLRTHPSAAERLSAMRSQLTYETTPALSEPEWQALRSICGAMTAANPASNSNPHLSPKPAPRCSPAPVRRPASTDRDI